MRSIDSSLNSKFKDPVILLTYVDFCNIVYNTYNIVSKLRSI